MKKIVIAFGCLLSGLVTSAQKCPGISVESPSYEVADGDTLMFIAVTKDMPQKITPTYNWAISAGTIISGQGTSVIRVNTAGLAGNFVTATVELGGLDPKCVNTASSSAEVIPGAQLVVKGTFTNGQELKNAVQKFIAATQFKDPANAGTGFIFLYKAPNTTEQAMATFKKAIADAFEFNKILPYQYKIVEGGLKKFQNYEFYLLQEKAKEPTPSN